MLRPVSNPYPALVSMVKCIETCSMTYHLIALVEAVLSILVW